MAMKNSGFVKCVTPAKTKNAARRTSAMRFGQERGIAAYTSSIVAISRAQLRRVAGPATPTPRLT